MLSKTQMAWIKAGLFIAALLPLARLVVLGFQDNLSANPVEFVTHSTGFWALTMLMITLSMTPLRLLTGMTWQIQMRRMAGLFMFFYACLHFMTYVWLDHWFDWADITKDIVKHPYVLVGFTALMLSIPLAVTSNKAMMKRLGSRWKKLHSLVYVIAILGVLHFWWLVKKDIREPLLFALILLFLLGVRVYNKKFSAKNSRKPAAATANSKLNTNSL